MADIWCSGRDVAGAVCKDAQLRKKGETTIVTTDQIYGQANWSTGIRFDNCRDLAEKLKQLPFNGAHRIAVNSHGAPGEFYINGKDREALKIDNYSDQLKFPGLTELHLRSVPGGTILFVGCQMGATKLGSQLLEALSKNLFPGRRVVVFTTLGLNGSSPDTQQRSVEGRGFNEGVCTEPGSRDTPYDNTGNNFEGRSRDYERYFTRDPSTGKSLWADLKAMPWASETSKHAKVALDGKIITGADLDAKDAEPEPVGKWSVTLRPRRGGEQVYSYEFDAFGGVRWANPFTGQNGKGSWKLTNDRIRITWPSKTTERWDPPLSAQVVKGVCEMEGQLYALSAKKL